MERAREGKATEGDRKVWEEKAEWN